MRYVIDRSINDIISVHSKIFLFPFSYENYDNKLKKGYDILPVKFLEDEKLIGYCLVLDKHSNSSLHCWVGGVLPEYRNTGAFSGFIDWIIYYAAENDYKHITVNTDNNKQEIIRLLVKYGFNITGVSETKYGDGNKIMFVYDIYPQRKMRLSITDKCNMNCFFCHSEGNFTSNNNNISLPAIEQLLVQAQKMNFSEITVTGGEPLLYFEGLSFILSNCRKWIHPPKIKICTNGVLLDEDKIQTIKKYNGKIEFNISLHAIDNRIIELISHKKISTDMYDKMFSSLAEQNIDFRVNCVMLKGINDSRQALITFFDYALNMNINSVHLLELLVTKEQTELFKYYESTDETEEKIKSLDDLFEINILRKTNKKTTLILRKNNRFVKVVLFRLSCRCGCENCTGENDIKIGADMKLHPCYIDKEDCGDAVSDLNKAVELRDEFMKARQSNYYDEVLYWGD